MIVRMKKEATAGEASEVLRVLGVLGYQSLRVEMPFGLYAVGLGSEDGDPATLGALPGVEWARKTTGEPILASIKENPGGSVVALGSAAIGGEALAIIAGPCSVEDKTLLMTAARFVAAYGATALRGGAYKPRTSPYAFQGLGREGLEFLREVGEATGLPIVTEAMDPAEVEPMVPFVDCIQIGARSMQNFPLLRAAGACGKPVLLKRGPSAGIGEFINAAEYVLLQGNPNVILCERGIRTFETATRNTLDLNAVPVLKSRTHLPVLVDPSHGTGRRDAVIPMARAAVAAGADGLLVEVHPDPDRALSDGDQSLTPAQFRQLVEEIRPVAEAVGRKVALSGGPAFGDLSAARSKRTPGWGSAG
jgi:3-deoxy-7-phosphoheptulonate synthase